MFAQLSAQLGALGDAQLPRRRTGLLAQEILQGLAQAVGGRRATILRQGGRRVGRGSGRGGGSGGGGGQAQQGENGNEDSHDHY